MGTLPRVVVTGIGAETALGQGVSALWEGALLGLSAIRPVTRFDTRRFHARQAALIDRKRGPDGAELETLFARDAAVEALASCPDFGGGRAGIAVGTTLAGNGALTEWLAERTGGAGALSRGDPGALSRDLARRHGARGPVSTVSVACASGAAAVGLAAEWIREGHATWVLAGGADAISPFVFSGFDALRALSMSVARPFDVARDGLTLGEGAGFLLLEEEDQARRLGLGRTSHDAPGSRGARPEKSRRDRAPSGGPGRVRRRLRERPRHRDDVQRRDGGSRSGACPRRESTDRAGERDQGRDRAHARRGGRARGHPFGSRPRAPARPAHGRTREVAPGFAAMGRLRRSALAREADRRRAVD